MQENGIIKRSSRLMAVLFYSLALFNLLFIGAPFVLYLLAELRSRRNLLEVCMLLFMTGSFLGPTLLAATSPRMRMLFEPFMILYATQYLWMKRTVLGDLFKKYALKPSVAKAAPRAEIFNASVPQIKSVKS
jgi:hypothetical protein